MNRPEVPISVLVCTRNRPDDLRRCVTSILDGRFRRFELLVVDQSDGEESAAFIESLADHRVRLIRTETRGLAKARNLAVLNATAPIVAFTDDDCICDPGWIEAIVAEFERHADIDGLFGRVLPWGDRFADGFFCHCLIPDEDERIVAEPVPPHRYLGHGNNMAFRIQLFQTIGLYNPEMGAGSRVRSGEDTDVTYRALRARRGMKYSPRPLVYHNNWNDLDAADRLDLGYVMGFVMVFGKFFLSGDRVAGRCLRERLGELVRDLVETFCNRDWRKFRRTVMKFGYFAWGIPLAVYFRIRGDTAWPTDGSVRSIHQ